MESFLEILVSMIRLSKILNDSELDSEMRMSDNVPTVPAAP